MARKQHPMRGKSVGSTTCSLGNPSNPCGAPVTLVVSQFGPLYYSCGACSGKGFYGAADSADYLLEHEAKKQAEIDAVKPTEKPITQEKVNKDAGRTTDSDMWA